MTRPHKLADHVRPRALDARIEQQWAAIEAAGLPGPVPARSRLPGRLAGALALAAVAALALVYLREPHALAPGALLESPEAEIAVQLEDGSRVELSPRSQLQLLENRAQSVALELRAGTARFAVTHDRARRFAIKAGPAEVRVIGTRFELTREQLRDAVRVHLAVSEGVVEVLRHDLAGEEPQRIRAGESWSALIPKAAPPRAPEPSRAAEPGAEREPEAEPEPELELAPAAPEPREARRAASLPGKPQPAETQPESGASAIFMRANLARRAGRMREAAEGYTELLARHPGDQRAGLSAFELGRIRMDALGDEVGAIAALEQALQAGGSATFHEDALARIVVASDALGRTDACRSARERYLARYPDGVHARALEARCR